MIMIYDLSRVRANEITLGHVLLVIKKACFILGIIANIVNIFPTHPNYMLGTNI